MLDYHMHTFHSDDGKMTMEQACAKAAEVGLKEIAITDHMDIDFPGGGWIIRELDKYINEVKELQEKFSGKLTIKLGIEMGLQPQSLDKISKVIKEHPFDFVIGSIHLVNGDDPYLPKYYEARDKIKSYIDYYTAIYEQVKDFNDFCVVGHLDYPRRYMPFPYDAKDHMFGIDVVDSILKLLISKGKGIEVNTSGYRHLSEQSLPHQDIVKRYKELGGEIITIGSDAHMPEHVGFENKRALAMIKDAGFKYITSFTQMKPSFVKI